MFLSISYFTERTSITRGKTQNIHWYVGLKRLMTICVFEENPFVIVVAIRILPEAEKAFHLKRSDQRVCAHA